MARGLLVFLTTVLSLASGADVLETRDGRILQGTFLGGTQQSVRFEASGSVQVLSRDEVLAVTFVPGSVASEPAAAPSVPPASPPPATASATPTAQSTATTAPPAQTPPTTVSPEAPPAPVAATATPAPGPSTLARVPAGTHLQVRIRDGIDARLAAVGDTFTATLETGLGIDGRAILPAGSTVEGRVAEVRDAGAGGGELKLELTALRVQGQRLELVTGPQTASPAAAHAAPPAAGAPAAARPGIQAGSLMEFRLLQPVDLRIQ